MTVYDYIATKTTAEQRLQALAAAADTLEADDGRPPVSEPEHSGVHYGRELQLPEESVPAHSGAVPPPAEPAPEPVLAVSMPEPRAMAPA